MLEPKTRVGTAARGHGGKRARGCPGASGGFLAPGGGGTPVPKFGCMPSTVRLVQLSAGVLLSHTLVTILEEFLFADERFLRDAGTSFLTLVMYVLTLAAYFPAVHRTGELYSVGRPKAALLGSPRGRRPQPGSFALGILLAVSVVNVGSSTLTKAALAYIDVPTQTVLKSAKLLPVMLGSVVIVRRRFTPAEWLAASMLVSGIVLFTTANRGQTEVAGGAAGQPRCGRQIRVFQPLETTRAWQSYSKPLTSCSRAPRRGSLRQPRAADGASLPTSSTRRRSARRASSWRCCATRSSATCSSACCRAARASRCSSFARPALAPSPWGWWPARATSWGRA